MCPSTGLGGPRQPWNCSEMRVPRGFRGSAFHREPHHGYKEPQPKGTAVGRSAGLGLHTDLILRKNAFTMPEAVTPDQVCRCRRKVSAPWGRLSSSSTNKPQGRLDDGEKWEGGPFHK